jgi:outer membrane protein assembly factor BamB
VWAWPLLLQCTSRVPPECAVTSRAGESPAAVSASGVSARTACGEVQAEALPNGVPPGDFTSMCPSYALAGRELVATMRPLPQGDALILFNDSTKEGVALRPLNRAEWCWPTLDEKHTWLFRHTQGVNCTPAVEAYEPTPLGLKWRHEPGVGEFRVLSALERDGVLIVNIEWGTGSDPRHQRLVALRVDDGVVLWQADASTGSCHIEFEPASQSVLSLCSDTKPELSGRLGSSWSVRDARSGQLRWQQHFSGEVSRREGAPGHLVIVQSGSTVRVTDIDLGRGQASWSRDFGALDPDRASAHACCSGVFGLGDTLLVQDGAAPARLRRLDRGTGKDLWQIDLPRSADVQRSHAGGSILVLVDGSQPQCTADRPCSVDGGYHALDARTGRLLARVDAPRMAPQLTERAPAIGADTSALFVEVSAPDGKGGFRSRIAAYQLPGGRRTWLSRPAQCSSQASPRVLVDAERVYSCECDAVVRVYTRAGKLDGSWGAESCDDLRLEDGKLFIGDLNLTREHWTTPPTPLHVSGRIVFGHSDDEAAFSGWVQIGERLVRPSASGWYSVDTVARGFTLVQPLHKLNTRPQVDERYVPPGEDHFQVDDLSVGHWQ